MITATHSAANNKQGSGGKYVPLRKRGKRYANQDAEFNYLRNTDLTMQFNNAQDPIYFAFDYLENRTVPQLMGDFVKDSFFEIANFVTKVL